jgi:beta-lactamase regulating signal transducer with metallopeptidase domain
MAVLRFLCDPTWQRVGLALVHSLWQGLLVAVVAHGLIRLSCRRPVSRYAGYLLALLVMAACPVVTFLSLDAPAARTFLPAAREHPGSASDMASATETAKPSDPAAESSRQDASEASEGDANASGGLAAWRQFAGASVQAVLPWAVAAWLAGVAVLSASTLAGLIAVRRWRRQLVELPADIAAEVPGLCRRLGLRAIPRVSLSLRVPAAMTIGWLQQIVLLPVALATQMPTEMLRAVISHELAHIRRRDPWVTLLQRVVEVLLF